MTRYPLLDWFRVALATIVVLAHSGFGHQLVPAVPGFLAISGLVVLQSYERTGNWLRFVWKRACRLVPAFLVSLVLCGVLYNWQAVLNSLQFYLTLGLTQPKGFTNGVLWSLLHEELAYAFLAVIFALGAYRAKVPIWGLLAVSVVYVFWGWANIKHPFLRASCCLPVSFFLGNLAWMYREKITVSGWWGVPLILLASRLEWIGHRPEATILTAVAVLLMGMRIQIPEWKKMPDFSFSIYVYHIPIMFTFGHKWPGICILLATCAVSWYLIEKPALRLKDLHARPRGQEPVGAGVVYHERPASA